jgi:hypothetical protein
LFVRETGIGIGGRRRSRASQDAGGGGRFTRAGRRARRACSSWLGRSIDLSSFLIRASLGKCNNGRRDSARKGGLSRRGKSSLSQLRGDGNVPWRQLMRKRNTYHTTSQRYFHVAKHGAVR